MYFHIWRTCYAQLNAARVNFGPHLVALFDPIRSDKGIFDFSKRAVEKFLTVYGIYFPNSVLKAPLRAGIDYNESAPYLCYDPIVIHDEYLAK